MQQAQRIADEAALMYLDELIKAGKVKDIFNHAQKELTRNYIKGHFGLLQTLQFLK